jgi:hypothetical protein
MSLIGTNLISEFVETIIYTGFLKYDAPQSAMLIAAPESGKTSIATDKNARSVVVCSDMIGSGLVQELKNNPEIHHIVINDMIAVMAHKQVTNQRTIAVMMGLMAEGSGRALMPGDLSYDLGKRRAGFICCIPSQLVNDERRWWSSSGFASRAIPFNYHYSREILIKIKDNVIIPGLYSSNGAKPLDLKTPLKKIPIKIPDLLASRIQRIADEIATTVRELGLRKGIQMRALACAHALLCNRKEVDQDDITFLERIKPFINFEVATNLTITGEAGEKAPTLEMTQKQKRNKKLKEARRAKKEKKK